MSKPAREQWSSKYDIYVGAKHTDRTCRSIRKLPVSSSFIIWVVTDRNYYSSQHRSYATVSLGRTSYSEFFRKAAKHAGLLR